MTHLFRRRTIRLAMAVVLAASGLFASAGQTHAAAADSSAEASAPRLVALGTPVSDASFPEAMATSMVNPAKDPIGANNWRCKPSAAHPYPVVLVHGTWANAYANWNGFSQILTHYGYCVFAMNYGHSTAFPFLNGTGDMINSANEIARFIEPVLTATGAPKIDLIGHSQGGAQARYHANLIGGPTTVNQVIEVAPSNHPTTMHGLTTLAQQMRLFGVAMELFELLNMQAGVQQADHSPAPQAPFYQELNDAGETVPGLSHTNILSKYDEVMNYDQATITAGQGASVDNIVIQNLCPRDLSDHVSVAYSKNVIQVILNKLDPSDQRPIHCYAQAALFGGTMPS